MFPSALREGLNCGMVVLSKLLRCLSDISSFTCLGQEGRERNGFAWSDPTRNAGLSGVCLCECYKCMYVNIYVRENLCLLKDLVGVSAVV